MNPRIYLCLTIFVLTAACEGRNTGGPGSLSGSAVAVDLIKSGDLVVYSYVDGVVGEQLGRTDFNGKFDLELPPFAGPLLLRLENAEIIDLATGEQVTFNAGEVWELAIEEFRGNVGSISLRVQLTTGGTININPITTIASAYARSLIARGKPAEEAIPAAYTEMEKYFGFDIVSLEPNSIGTDLGAVDQRDHYGILLAGLSQLAMDISVANEYTPGKRFTLKDITQRLVLDIEGDGLLNGVSGEAAVREGNYRFTQKTFREELSNSIVAILSDEERNRSSLKPTDISPWLETLATMSVAFLPSSGEVLPEDHTAPELAIEEPKDGDSYHGTIIVSAHAEETESWITDLRVWVEDPSDQLKDDDESAEGFQGTLETTAYANGDITLHFVASNPLGFSTEKSVTIQIDNIGPTLSLYYFDGCLEDSCRKDLNDGYAFRGSLTIGARATDTGGTGLDLFDVVIDGRKLGDEDPDPFIYRHKIEPMLQGFEEGPFSIQVTAIDGASNVAVEARTLHVNNDTFNEQLQISRAPLPARVNDYGWRWGSVSNAGDLNEDGFEDVLVVDSREPYLRLGAANPSEAFKQVWAIAPGAWHSAAGNCDVNGDGHKDLVLGSADLVSGGTIRVYLGPMTGPSTFQNGYLEYIGKTWTAFREGAGRRVLCGNMDGARGDEVIYLPDSEINPGSGWQRTYDYLTVLSWQGDQWIVYETDKIGGMTQNNYYAPSLDANSRIAGPVDVNGDGFADFLLTDVRGYPESTTRYSMLVFGGAAGQFRVSSNLYLNYKTPDASQPDGQTGLPSFWPIRPHALGDLDGDGYGEIAIGEMNYCHVTWECGYGGNYSRNPGPRVMLIFGGPAFPNDPRNRLSFRHPQPSSNDFLSRFGEGMTVGDFDGDGKVDLAIGVPDRRVSFPAGEVLVFYGPDFSSRYETYQPIRSGYPWLGGYLLGIDANHDSRTDLLMSAWGGPDKSWAGEFELLYDSL